MSTAFVSKQSANDKLKCDPGGRVRRSPGRPADELEGEDYWAYVAEHGFPDEDDFPGADDDMVA